ncbi:MAG: hypothetical protein IPP14_08390 [Planctomycetes bacterium]|nr:hypothetical protein [Planctomycetota bacterium]
MRYQPIFIAAILRARLSALTGLTAIALSLAACGAGAGGGTGGLAINPPTNPGGGTPGNTAPVITSTAPTTATVGQLYNYQAVATDAEGGTLTWNLTVAPTGMAVNTTGLVTWTPTAAQVGAHVVTLRVTDGTAATLQNWNVQVATPAGGLPASVTLTDMGALPNGMLVLSDMAEFDGKLYIAAAIAPLGSPFGAGIYYYNGTSIQTAFYDSGSQGFVRAKVYDNKLYVPDGDPNGLTPGKVYIFSPGSSTPLATNVTNCVHNFDVVKYNGQLYVSGANGSGQSSLNKFNAATSTWDAASTGNFGRLKYMGVLDNSIWCSKQVQAGLDGVWVDSAMSQAGFLASASGGNLISTVEEIDGKLYMNLWGSSVSNFIVSPGSTVTTITSITGLMWDVIKHSDGNCYAVAWDGTNDRIYGSTDGVNFTSLYSLAGSKFGQPPSNADGRPSIASFGGKLYVGSSTNGHLYRLD